LFVFLYLLSTLGDIWNAILLVALLLVDMVFFTVIFTALNVRLDYYVVIVLLLVLFRFFAVPVKELWFTSLPLAGAYHVIGIVDLLDTVALVVVYIVLALIIYWRVVKE